MQIFRFRHTTAVTIGALVVGLSAGTASATMISDSITADRSSNDYLQQHAVQRYDSTLYRPRDGAFTISGNVDLGDLSNGGALFVGLVDADFYNSVGDKKTYQSGAYAFFAPSGGAHSFGPSDGNAGGGEVVQNFGDLGDTTDVDFSLTINPDGTLSATYAGQKISDAYGDVKARPDLNGGDSTPYAADEFANGAYLAVELSSASGGPQTVNYELDVPTNGANDVPEPSELGLLGLGALLIGGGIAFRRRRSQLIG